MLHVHTYAARLHVHLGCDDVFKVAWHLGEGWERMARGPAVETFQFTKCVNQVTGEGGGTEIKREWNS